METPSVIQDGRSDIATAYKQSGLPAKPDVMVMLTDQERFPAHWPGGFVESRQGWTRLQKNGLTFLRAGTSDQPAALAWPGPTRFGQGDLGRVTDPAEPGVDRGQPTAVPAGRTTRRQGVLWGR